MVRGLAVFLVLIVATAALAQRRCSEFRAFAKAMPGFDLTKQILVTRNGVTLPLTFSHDSEITEGAALNALRKHPDYFTIAAKTYAGLDYTVEELAETLGLSPSDVRVLAIHKGEKAGLGHRYNLSQLNPYYLDLMIALIKKTQLLRYIWKDAAREAFSKQLEEEGLPQTVVKEEEDNVVEMKHRGYVSTPSALANALRPLRRKFPRLYSHTHIGLPSAVISKDEAVEITQAVETRIILNHFLLYPENTVEQKYYSYSALRDGAEQHWFEFNQRGFTKLRLDRFNQGNMEGPSHDLEIRVGGGSADQLEFVGFAVQLASQPERLARVELQPSTITDRISINLSGALRYAGLHLTRSKRGDDHAVGKALVAFSNKIEKEQIITPLLRSEIGRYCEEHDVLDRITVDLFRTRPN